MDFHDSIWQSLEPKRKIRTLDKDIETDVAVIGGGITGVSSAYHLSKVGIKTILIEKERIGYGGTGHSAGILVVGNSMDFKVSAELYGMKSAAAIWEATIGSINSIVKTVKDENISCELLNTGALYMAYSSNHVKRLKDEHKLLAKQGMHSTFIEQSMIKDYVNCRKFYGALKTDFEYTLNPLSLINGLLIAAEKNGVKVFESTASNSIRKTANGYLIKTTNATITAKRVINATNPYGVETFNSRIGYAIYNEYDFCTAPLSKVQLQKLAWKKKTPFWDTRDMYAYTRMLKGNRVLFGFGHPFIERGAIVRFRKKNIKMLYKMLVDFFPMLGGIKITNYWMGTTTKTNDALPVISIENKSYMYSFGYNGHGLAMGLLAGRLMANAMQGKSSKIDRGILKVYSPHRKIKLPAKYIDTIRLKI